MLREGKHHTYTHTELLFTGDVADLCMFTHRNILSTWWRIREEAGEGEGKELEVKHSYEEWFIGNHTAF